MSSSSDDDYSYYSDSSIDEDYIDYEVKELNDQVKNISIKLLEEIFFLNRTKTKKIGKIYD
jgi:hypothetical protein